MLSKLKGLLSKKTYFRVMFRDHKGAIRTATIKAETRIDAYYEFRRIFGNAEFIVASEVLLEG